MTTVSEHYANHLAPVYAWMVGGIDDALARGQRELAGLGLTDVAGGYAVDLGAGFGMHSIPLARSGWKVLAIDSSADLLAELEARTQGVAVSTVCDDLLNFQHYLSGTPSLILCMGDTLTHLPSLASVETLLRSVGARLAPAGRFISTFRDYSRALEGTDRFISVKSDDDRISTCFLEYGASTIRIHDVLHERRSGGWAMRVSAYDKLRLEPEWLKQRLEGLGFTASTEVGPSGMARITAMRG